MEDLYRIISYLLAAAATLAALPSILLFFRLQWPSPVLWILKLFVSAFAWPVLFLGLLVLVTGLIKGPVYNIFIGVYLVLVFAAHIIRVTRAPGPATGFARAFGPAWKDRLRPAQTRYFIRNPLSLKLPAVPDPILTQDIVFAIVPDTGRELLCDIWRPPEHGPRSGVAFIYLHGSAWYFLDKDLGTRPLFRHLAAQGHLVMDVAYRLSPETDMMGMVQDVKRAISWLKNQSASYGIDPERIIIGGGSAGGHLALLAAYTAPQPTFDPAELAGRDFRVNAVISLYGPTDLRAFYYHTNQHLTKKKRQGRLKRKKRPTRMPAWIRRKMGKNFGRLGFDRLDENTGGLAPLLGGQPEEIPGSYSFYSPLTYVNAHSPATLMIQGRPDIITPARNTRILFEKLLACQVPAILLLIPGTDHAFDLIQPKISPSAHNAICQVERFMALFAG